MITFEERAANSPEAIKAWFYPGDNYGQEFVYPKPRAVQLAKVVKQPVPSMPANLEANTKMPAKSAKEAPVMALKKAPVKAEQPTGEEVEIAEVVHNPAATPRAEYRACPSSPSPRSRLPSCRRRQVRCPWSACLGSDSRQCRFLAPFRRKKA